MSSVGSFWVSVDWRCGRQIPTFRSDQSRRENQVSAIAWRIAASYLEWLFGEGRCTLLPGPATKL